MIAQCIEEMSFIRTPILCIITGEGGSGGALAIGVGDRIAGTCVVFGHLTGNVRHYPVAGFGPCPQAAELLRLTPADLLKFGI